MSKKIPDILTEEEQSKLLNQFNKRYFTGFRNYLIVRLALVDALRESELIFLKWEDMNLNTGRIHLKITKGLKHRVVFTGKELLKEFKEYIKRFDLKPEGYVFPTHKGTYIKDSYLRKMVPEKAKKAGIKKRVYVHLLRHTAGTRFYEDSGCDLIATRDFMGHSDISSTQIYAHISGMKVEETIKNRDFSYMGE